MWSQLLLISDKKYDLDWIREERELMDAGRYYDNLSAVLAGKQQAEHQTC